MRLFIAVLFFIGLTGAAQADVSVVINRATQTMTATIDGTVHTWRVSTGKRGHSTPAGPFRVQSMDRNHYSSLYDDAHMPFSIFFNGDVAIHGTTDLGRLGSPVSHGCVRLNPAHAKILFDAVSRQRQNTSIQVL